MSYSISLPGFNSSSIQPGSGLAAEITSLRFNSEAASASTNTYSVGQVAVGSASYSPELLNSRSASFPFSAFINNAGPSTTILLISGSSFSHNSWRSSPRTRLITHESEVFGHTQSGAGLVGNLDIIISVVGKAGASRLSRRSRGGYFHLLGNTIAHYQKTGGGAFSIKAPNFDNDILFQDKSAWRPPISQSEAWNINLFGVADGTITVAVDGVSATGSVGTATVTGAAQVTATGVSATGSVGTATATGAAQVTATGVSATGSIGTVTVSTGTGVSVSVDGVSATGSVGSVTVTGAAQVSASGVSGTGSVGTATATGAAQVSATGVSATGSVGDTTVSTGTGVSTAVSGVGATGSSGTASVTGAAQVSADGVSATGSVGDVSETGGTGETEAVDGVSATGSVGTAACSGDSNTTGDGNSCSGSIGSLSVTGAANVSVSGVASTGSVGAVSVVGSEVAPEPEPESEAPAGKYLPWSGVTYPRTSICIPARGSEMNGRCGVVSVSVTQSATILPTGVAARAHVGSVKVSCSSRSSVSGVVASIHSGTARISGSCRTSTDIKPSPNEEELILASMIWLN